MALILNIFFKIIYLFKRLHLFLTLLCLNVGYAQTTYYIDAVNGLDSNTGSSIGNEWQSISKVNSSTFLPGDQILFKSSQEFFGSLIPPSSGDSNAYITFGKYGGEARPTINGRNFRRCISVSAKAYLKFENLILTNDSNEDTTTPESGATTRRHGFYAHVGYTGSPKKNIVIDNLKIHKIYPNLPNSTENTDSYLGYGITFTSDGKTNNNYFDGITIQNTEITDIGSVGISINKWIPDVDPPNAIYQQNININNNNLHHIGGSGIVFFNVQNFLIENNLVTYTGDYSLDTRQHGRGSGFWSVRCRDGILQHNEFSHVRGAADSCGAHIDIDNDNVIIQYNLSYDNAGGFAEYMGANTNCIYRYNISINDGFRVKHTHPWNENMGPTIEEAPEMYTPSGERNTQNGKIIWFSDFTGFEGQTKVGAKINLVYNNTIYIGNDYNGNPITSLISFENDTDYNEVRNNIFYIEPGSTLNFDKSATVGTNNVFSNNLYSNGGPTDTFFQGTNDLLNTNPLFQNTGGVIPDDYKLDNGSPAIDTGVLINNNGNQDYWGNSLGNNPPTDIGAHEVSATLGTIDTQYNQMKIFPNPATNRLYINDVNQTTSINIYDISGKLVLNRPYNNGITIENLKNGFYIIKIKDSKSLLFIKN